jgi:lipopolysaccharide transport system ATP-binding protein
VKEFAILSLKRQVAYESLWALTDVGLQVHPGELFGVVGPNGAGKSSLLKVIARVVPPTRGRVIVRGSVAPLIALGTGFHGELTAQENIVLHGAILGRAPAEMRRRIDAIAEWAGLEQFLDVPVRTYSSGMLARLAFAIATDVTPEVLLVDEVLAVGDEAFQRKCLRHIRSRIEGGTTVVLVSHAPGTIEAACRRVVVLDHGRVAFDGPTTEGLRFYHRMLGLEDASQAAAREARPGAVALREASLLDGEGRPRQVFEPGEPIKLALELAAGAAAADVEIVIEVRQAAGQPVFKSSTPVATASGDGTLLFEVPRLTLLGGDYDIAIGVHEPGDTAPGIDRLLSFSVVSIEDAEGIADLRGTWTFTGARIEVGR